MTTEIVQQSLFDYGQLDTETRIVVQQRTEEIKVLVRRSAQDIIDIGNKLIDVKARLGHGYFGKWLEAEFGWTWKTATRFMDVAGKFDNLSNLENFGASALYLLAAPSTPDAARAEAIERAQAGEVITHKIATDIANGYKATSTPPTATHIALQPTMAITFVAPHIIDEYEEMAEELTEDEEGYDWSQEEPQPAPVDHKNGYTNGHGHTFVAPVAPNHMAIHYSSETPEHYTPKEIIEATIAVLGAVDLDPCSNSKDKPNVPALEHFTIADDGLSLPWFGRVYMNPPYGRGIYEWVSKLVKEYESGNVTEAVALLPARVDTQWKKLLRNYMRCEIEGRLTFVGNDDPAPFPSMVYYLGENAKNFYEIFNQLGDIMVRLDEGWFTD